MNGGSHSEFLVGAGCVAIWESCWIGHELYGKYGANLSRKVKNKEIIVEDYSHMELEFRFAAAAAGAPFSVTQTALGTDIHNPEYDMLGRAGLRDGQRIGKQKYQFMNDPFFGAGQQVLCPAAKVAIALMAVQQVGEEGTVRVAGQYYADPEVARAAARDVRDNEVVFAGSGLPMVAIMLAQKTHAPNLQLIFEAGSIGALPLELPTSVGDARCEV